MKIRSAFTLIELLVVIAIIAILAAILFPVFAQAKAAAKKTADLSNMKQVQTGTLIYLGDSDDLYPIAFGQDSTGAWKQGFRLLAPANWSTAASTDARVQGSYGLVQNIVQPYTKSYDLFSSPGGTSDPSPLSTTYGIPAGYTPKKFTPTYNGLLMSYNSTGMQSPATVPVYWDSYGAAAMVGYSLANPELSCATASTACSYIPISSSGTCASGNGGSGVMYGASPALTQRVLGPGQNWSYADGHAKFKHMASTTATGQNSNYLVDPWVGYDVNGVPNGSYWYDGCFAWLFRPDYVSNN